MTHFKAKSVAEYAQKKFEVEQPFFHPIWECRAKVVVGDRGKTLEATSFPIYIEAERWVDARAFAVKQLGAVEVTCERVEYGRPFPRTQIRWVGTAASRTMNPLRQEKRFVANELRMKRAAWEPVE